jgi:hypothetical protein
MNDWRSRVGSAISQLVNAALPGGHEDESLSARAHYEQHTSRFWAAVRVASDTLFFRQPDHCAKSAESDAERAEFVIKRWQGFKP